MFCGHPLDIKKADTESSRVGDWCYIKIGGLVHQHDRDFAGSDHFHSGGANKQCPQPRMAERTHDQQLVFFAVGELS